MNRLPGMHEMGLEHLLLEEPIPQAPATPTSSATVAPAPAGGGAGAAGGGPPRPTAPGKRSIPWAYDAIGPLSQLARQVCVERWLGRCVNFSFGFCVLTCFFVFAVFFRAAFVCWSMPSMLFLLCGLGWVIWLIVSAICFGWLGLVCSFFRPVCCLIFTCIHLPKAVSYAVRFRASDSQVLIRKMKASS